MNDEVEELRFEEIDDDEFLAATEEQEDEVNELKPEQEDIFAAFYTPIRTVFANDAKLLEKLSSCKNHQERLLLLLEQEIVKTKLAELSIEKDEAVTEEVLPQKPDPEAVIKPWKTLPKLSYGPHKKFPHLSKAIEVFSAAKAAQEMLMSVCQSVSLSVRL